MSQESKSKLVSCVEVYRAVCHGDVLGSCFGIHLRQQLLYPLQHTHLQRFILTRQKSGLVFPRLEGGAGLHQGENESLHPIWGSRARALALLHPQPLYVALAGRNGGLSGSQLTVTAALLWTLGRVTVGGRGVGAGGRVWAGKVVIGGGWREMGIAGAPHHWRRRDHGEDTPSWAMSVAGDWRNKQNSRFYYTALWNAWFWLVGCNIPSSFATAVNSNAV